MSKPLGFSMLFFLFGVSSLHSQIDSLEVNYDKSEINPTVISENDISEYLADDKFDYTIQKLENTWWDGVKNWFYNSFRSFFEWLFGGENAAGYLAVFLRLLPYILAGVLLFLIIRFFIKANSRAILHGKQNKALVSLSEEERIIKTEDIQQLIKDAIAEKDYRLAIRYYYLYILKLLSEHELIEWQLQKTNDDYEKELSNTNLKVLFGKATLLYDYIWYGEYKIDLETYTKATQPFNSLKENISENE